MLRQPEINLLFALCNDRTSFFSLLPTGIDRLVSSVDYDTDPDSEISIALCHAARGTQADIEALVEMVKTNPRILFQAGDVTTRGGVPIKRIKLYEFFLGEGDPDGADKIVFGFEKLKDEGEAERERQHERYRPHIEALAKQIETKQPAFDLRPLIKVIKDSTDDEITDALNINDTILTVTRNTPLRKELAKFRRAVQPKTEGMHYEHYTTLMQAFDLLYNEWKALSNGYKNHSKCDLVWRQVIGYLQRSLPAVDRFAFARGFNDADRTVNYKSGKDSFPNISFGCEDLSDLGFDNAIFALQRPSISNYSRIADLAASGLKATCEKKFQSLQNLCSAAPPAPGQMFNVLE